MTVPEKSNIISEAMDIFAYERMRFIMAKEYKIAVLGAIVVAAAVYAVTIFLVRGISGDDVKLLPKGATIYRILNKLKLVK